MTDRRNAFAEQFGHWGRVPRDGDVLPFSMVSLAPDGTGHPKKKHHYISATYMEGWTAEDGRVWAYRPDEPADPHRSHPLSIGYRKHYYSQTNETGERDDHRWEDLWGCIETVWQATLRAVRDKRLGSATRILQRSIAWKSSKQVASISGSMTAGCRRSNSLEISRFLSTS